MMKNQTPEIDYYKKELCRLGHKTDLAQEDLNLVSNFLNYYFRNNRPQVFSKQKAGLLKKFVQLIDLNANAYNGISFASAFFLFNYTHTNNYTEVQKDIYEHIALPYRDWLLRVCGRNSLEPLHYKLNEEVLYIVRHATTAGLYAPGQSAFVQCKSLLDAGHRVTLMAMGQISREFATLATHNSNLTMMQMKPNLPLDSQFAALQRVVLNLRPKLILTEIEFELVSALSIVGCSSPIFLMSAGYFNLPWYDKLGLFDLFQKNNMSKRKNDVFYFPMSVDTSILAPVVKKCDVEQMRAELGFLKNDFVFGCFARKEKFSDLYIQLCQKVLQLVPHSKLLIAGPNDDQHIKTQLADALVENKAQVLGTSNVHVLGQLIDVGLETFPCASGSSILELMAKGKPVVSVTEFEATDIHCRLRVNENVMLDADRALEKMISLAHSPDRRRRIGKASEAVIERAAVECRQKFCTAIETTLEPYLC